MAPVRVGLLGYGMAGQVFHAPLIRQEPGLHLVTVASSRAEQIARDVPGVEAVPSVDAVIARPDIDLIVVATPNQLHFPHAKAALEAGKHVVIDKPFVVDLAQADALMALADRHQRVLSVFQNRRWDSGFLTARQAMADGSLGEIYYYEAHYDRFRPAIKPGWREVAGDGAGVFFDLGAHLADQAVCLFGMPDAVTADIQVQRADAQVDDYFHVVLHYGRRRAVLHGSMLTRMPGPSLALHGDRGSLLVYGLDGQETALKALTGAGGGGAGPAPSALLDDGGGPRPLDLAAGDYPAYYRGVAAAIRDGVPPPVTARQARDAFAVLAAAQASAARRQTVSLA